VGAAAVETEAPLRTPGATFTPEAAVPPPATAAVTPDADVDPLTRIEVKSWWSLGGGPADLGRAIDACVAKLGAEHRPDAAATVVTTAMHACLREAGSYSLGGSGTR
jgi:hypothetical protein